MQPAHLRVPIEAKGLQMFDYLRAFPIPAGLLPERLRMLLEPVGLDPALRVEVSSMIEIDPHGPGREYTHMLMAVVDDDGSDLPPALNDSHGVVAYSVPELGDKGASKAFSPGIDGHDYIVASWGSGSFYTYNLAEKIWMALGLTPRCIGNEEQRLVYDDLRLPEFGVAEGEVSGQYYWQASRNISWVISNEYLRKYLWMRGARGVRVFFYEALLPDLPELRDLMHGERHLDINSEDGWFLLSIQEHNGGLLIQVWATVEAVTCELCPEQTAEGLAWPGVPEVVTHANAHAMIDGTIVYLDDRFLERYEQNRFYNSTPVKVYGQTWHCSPSYLGQWSFTGCQRIGRNLIKVSMRDLYEAKPDREILHAHAHAVDPATLARVSLDEEHIVSKTERLAMQLLDLGDNLSSLGRTIAIERSAFDLVNLSREEIAANGWMHYPQLCRLAQVAPLDMSQQAFLARCKSIHELWQCIPTGFLRRLVEAAGVPREAVAGWGSLKLVQSLLNIIDRLDRNDEEIGAYRGGVAPDGWDSRNANLAALFVCNDLRIADAHDVGQNLQRLQDLGFDTASLHRGYGLALDFVFDGVIKALAAVNQPLRRVLNR
ncbi:hypothetical protein [Burkholderia sp. PU8-34]